MLRRSKTVFDEGVRGPHAVLASSIRNSTPSINLDRRSDQDQNVTISHDGVYRITIGNQQEEESIEGEVDVTDPEGESNFFP